MQAPPITKRLLSWHKQHGRSDLPWQARSDAYGIWLSEIMLQQTQVATVIPYYLRFLERFPSVKDLACAEIDEVLHLWTGLGYYARARNLHKAAQMVAGEFNGEFPTNLDDMLRLPGVGKSTAGAILAFSEQQRHAILDGNVKRVLSRYYGVAGWYGVKSVEKQLWQLAELNTPTENVATYTQAIMDFGATHCSRSKPACDACVLAADCIALKTDRVAQLPEGKPKKAKPKKQTAMVFMVNDQQEVLLVRNPPSGIWGGLWCPPQLSVVEFDPAQYIKVFEHTAEVERIANKHRHVFTHFELDITPIVARYKATESRVSEQPNQVWYNVQDPPALGMAAPVKKLLATLF
ncbi:MAG: A/G-specific adenine glycosylase [Pseudomonadota bacterium]